MKNRLLFLWLVCFSLSVTAQRNYFIYLQSESQQAFYVRSGNTIHSSSASGYLILSQLKDSAYTFTIGLPANKYGPQDYSIAVNRKDQGYLFKNFGEKGWGLFNLQTLAVIMPVDKTVSNQPAMLHTPVNNFTDLLSKAADDSTLRMKPVVAKKEEPTPALAPVAAPADTVKPVDQVPVVQEKIPLSQPAITQVPPAVTEKKQEIQPVLLTDTVKAASAAPELIGEKKTEPPPAVVSIPDTATTIQPVATPVINTEAAKDKGGLISLLSATATTEGKRLVYIEKFENGNADTVELLVPAAKEPATMDVPAPEEKKFLDISSDPAKDSVKNEVIPVVEQAKTLAFAPCKSVAGEDDFVKLRRRMVSRSNDDDMIAEAKKYFKSKCFSTTQLRNLSSIFLSDAGKYNFFDASYPYVSDRENFSSLQSELKTEYQLNRFRAMLQ